jgi:hypothetical protein
LRNKYFVLLLVVGFTLLTVVLARPRHALGDGLVSKPKETCRLAAAIRTARSK